MHCYLSHHCGIDDDDEVVLTGGQDSQFIIHWSVTKYNMEGEATFLPALITARYLHACGKVTNADMETVSLG